MNVGFYASAWTEGSLKSTDWNRSYKLSANRACVATSGRWYIALLHCYRCHRHNPHDTLIQMNPIRRRLKKRRKRENRIKWWVRSSHFTHTLHAMAFIILWAQVDFSWFIYLMIYMFQWSFGPFIIYYYSFIRSFISIDVSFEHNVRVIN